MPQALSSLVRNEETNRPTPSPVLYGDVLRQSCLDRYEAADAVYSHLDELRNQSKRFDMENCRTNAWFVRHSESGSVRIAANACHLRWCPICSDAKRNYICRSVTEWVSEQSHPKFLTLTLKHSDAPLDFQVDHLYQSFRSLRKRLEFRKKIPGGLWFFQIKRSKSDGKWHPHLHCLISGEYFPVNRLSRIWLEITYTSTNVDIRPIRDPQKASNDAARYAASPGSLVGLPLSMAVELVEAMHGRRICGTWGTARKVSLRPDPLEDKGKWISIGGWSKVMQNRATDQNARAIAYAYYNNQPLEAGIDIDHLDPNAVRLHPAEAEAAYLDFMYPPERSPPYET